MMVHKPIWQSGGAAVGRRFPLHWRSSRTDLTPFLRLHNIVGRPPVIIEGHSKISTAALTAARTTALLLRAMESLLGNLTFR